MQINSREDAEAAMDASLFPSKPSYVGFFTAAEIDPAATAATGEGDAQYPVYRDVDYVGYRVKGEKDFVSMRVEHDRNDPERNHPKKHPKEWAEYLQRKASPRTDLRFAPFATPAVIETLRGIGIFTLEDLANYDGPHTLASNLEEHRRWAARFLQWANKPRMRLVNGQMVAA
jgi:hypothetical protein